MFTINLEDGREAPSKASIYILFSAYNINLLKNCFLTLKLMMVKTIKQGSRTRLRTPCHCSNCT